MSTVPERINIDRIDEELKMHHEIIGVAASMGSLLPPHDVLAAINSFVHSLAVAASTLFCWFRRYLTTRSLRNILARYITNLAKAIESASYDRALEYAKKIEQFSVALASIDRKGIEKAIAAVGSHVISKVSSLLEITRSGKVVMMRVKRDAIKYTSRGSGIMRREVARLDEVLERARASLKRSLSSSVKEPHVFTSSAAA